LFSNVAFGFGCTYLARLEEDGLGAQWDRITIKTLPDDDFNLSYCILMLVFDSIWYFLMTLYIEAVFPGENSSLMPKIYAHYLHADRLVFMSTF
jgi:ATP-binding cassette subfamily A (ABC1) protein 1